MYHEFLDIMIQKNVNIGEKLIEIGKSYNCCIWYFMGWSHYFYTLITDVQAWSFFGPSKGEKIKEENFKTSSAS